MSIENGKPDGYTTLTPFLVCSPAAEAIEFYQQVFGATLVSRMDGPDGTVPHAELDFGDGRLQLGDPADQFGLEAPSSGPGHDRVSGSTCIYVSDVDTVTEKAVAAGAVLREPPTTFVTGDRFASIYDPYGHRWAVMTRVEDVSPEEAERRLAEWASGGGLEG
ncbi:VOC family protein [Motilibacter deserti]|uniref:VOC family protein n=1 Tax=Motilibacter deserti TaxID=2714956 RepID=A0ABX0H486_9ACTN|nr:VOC family protein [Motilibacter deserti]NHC16577.1 VOC family protein [Motilibacter deserti]